MSHVVEHRARGAYRQHTSAAHRAFDKLRRPVSADLNTVPAALVRQIEHYAGHHLRALRERARPDLLRCRLNRPAHNRGKIVAAHAHRSGLANTLPSITGKLFLKLRLDKPQTDHLKPEFNTMLARFKALIVCDLNQHLVAEPDRDRIRFRYFGRLHLDPVFDD